MMNMLVAVFGFIREREWLSVVNTIVIACMVVLVCDIKHSL